MNAHVRTLPETLASAPPPPAAVLPCFDKDLTREDLHALLIRHHEIRAPIDTVLKYSKSWFVSVVEARRRSYDCKPDPMAKIFVHLASKPGFCPPRAFGVITFAGVRQDLLLPMDVWPLIAEPRPSA